MGCKACKIIATVFSLLLLLPMNSKAATISDVYKMYNIELTSMYPDGVLQTIADYQRCQRDEAMYKYVQKSQFDSALVDNKIKDLTAELNSIESTLLNSYDSSLDEIYELEDRWCTLSKSLDNAKKSAKSEKMSTKSLKSPSKNKYDTALQTKDSIDLEKDIGAVPMKYPVSGDYSINEVTEKHLILDTVEGYSVTPILNGKVVDVTKDSVTIKTDIDIYTYIGGLKDISVKKGEVVYQGQSLGYTTSTITFKLKIQGNIVDVNKLFQEG